MLVLLDKNECPLSLSIRFAKAQEKNRMLIFILKFEPQSLRFLPTNINILLKFPTAPGDSHDVDIHVGLYDTSFSPKSIIQNDLMT